MGKNLKTILRIEYQNYLDSINVKYEKTLKLSELIELIKRHNGSSPSRAVGIVTEIAIENYENQGGF